MKKENYLMLACGAILIVLGFVQLSGYGESSGDFGNDVYAPHRICCAPWLCMFGYLCVGLSLYIDLLKPRERKDS